MDIGQWLLDRQRRKPFNGRLIRGCDAQGDGDEVYMERYFLFKSRLLSVYLHHFLRSDTDRALHDHPWDFLTIILSGGYWEHTPHPSNPWPVTRRRWHGPGSILFRRATHRHYVELPKVGSWASFAPILRPEIPAITLCVVGVKWREWGFILPEGWTAFREAFAKWGCKP